jgi:hypothetical protein
MVRLVDDLAFSQLTLPFGRFFSQYVIGVRFREREFAGTRFSKPLGCGTICF